MGKLTIKNGTPVGNAHLCRSCTFAQIVTGYRESDLLAICTNTSPNLVLPFTVYECSSYADKYKPSWKQMKNLAIHIKPVRVSAKTRGFSAVTNRPVVRTDEPDDQQEVAQSK
jgi:hypothetical protein